MTDQQIFYQLLQCCPYDKTGFDAEEWESICQMAGAGKDSWALVKMMSKNKPIENSWLYRLMDSYYAPKKNKDGIFARCDVYGKWLQLIRTDYQKQKVIKIKHGKGKYSLVGSFVYSLLTNSCFADIRKIKAMFLD